MDNMKDFVDYCIMLGQSYAANQIELDDARKYIAKIMLDRETRARRLEREICAKLASEWFDSYVIDTVDAQYDSYALFSVIMEATK